MRIFQFAVSAIVASSFLAGAASAKDAQLEQAKAIFDWVSGTQDGIMSPKIEVRRENSDDLDSPMGVYATDTIEVEETIMKVPWSVIITPDDLHEPSSQLMCGTVRSVAREMRLGVHSKYAPYAMYLNGEVDAQIPSVWSRPGQELFMEIVQGDTIPPENAVSWIGGDWFQRCGGDPDDEFGIKAALLVLQRADDAFMIPAYDHINHRNGNWTNTVTESEPGEYQWTTASKTIQAGEQIYSSYNLCEECGGRQYGYGTAGKFHHENYYDVFGIRKFLSTKERHSVSIFLDFLFIFTV